MAGMVSGFNVDIKHGGKVFHVQTEDRGRRHPVIETLVYQAGKILHQERISYADQNDDANYSEAAISHMVDLQHKRIIDEIRGGRFDGPVQPFGEEFITNRSFDECVLEFLVAESENEALTLSLVGQSEMVPGKPAWVVVRAAKGSGEGIPGAVIRARLIRSEGGPVKLDEKKTDEMGQLRLSFELPAGAGNIALVVQATSDHGGDELHKLLV